MVDYNSEAFPRKKTAQRPNILPNTQLIGDRNTIHPSATNVICTGVGNYVGRKVKDSVVLGSSGCIIYDELEAVTLIDCSGVIATSSQVVYIKNVEFKAMYPQHSKITSVNNVTKSYAATVADGTILVDAGGADTTITIPSASNKFINNGGFGKIYNIKKIDSGAGRVIIDPASSQTIDGSTTAIITTQYDCITIQSDGANWHII